MLKRLLLISGLSWSLVPLAQTSSFTEITQNVYAEYPAVPRGLLEAVAFTQTRMTHLDATIQESCTGLPRAWGYLGLIADGEGYFRNNLSIVAQRSGIPASVILSDPQQELRAYAAAYTSLAAEKQAGVPNWGSSMEGMKEILLELTFIPDSGLVNDFARNSELFEIFRFLVKDEYRAQYGFPHYHFNLRSLFGNNYDVLSAARVDFSETTITTPGGQTYAPTQSLTKSTEYGPAIYNAAASCNYGSRSGTAISAITIHTIQGTYAGAISWAQNCSSSVSYHYVIRSSDGQVTQMVLEANKAYHAGSVNPYTIGYEHEGYVTQPQWYTDAMYNSSAALSRDVVASGYGIPALRTYFGASSATVQTLGGCTKIKGHQHYPNQTHTDPGINWNWEKYYRLINNSTPVTTLTAASGTFYDSGGSGGAYANDERRIWVFSPASVATVSLTFTQFALESNYDFLYIYDGNSINSTLIGVYSGSTSPGTITASGTALTVEFRSDCATTAAGWAASWSSATLDVEAPVTSVEALAGWQTTSFDAQFTDTDQGSGVGLQFARVSDRQSPTADWHANGNRGYLEEHFDVDANGWTEVTGDWSISNQAYVMNAATQENANAAIPLKQDSLSQYLYHWKQTITTAGTNQRAGIHFFCDNTSLPNRGNSYFVYLREETNKAEIYEVVGDTWTQRAVADVVNDENIAYDCKVVYDPSTGLIRFFVNNVLAVQWQDPQPLKAGTGLSLRSAGCGVRFDDVSVYKSRYNLLHVSLGADSLVRYQSSGSAPSAKVSSLIADYMLNWSTVNNQTYLIDWTAPQPLVLNDGISGPDRDSISIPIVSVNWNFAEAQSGIAHYSFAVGTSPTTQNVIPWTSAGMVESLNAVLPNPNYGQVYYVHVRATNNAGLVYQGVTDGQRLVSESQFWAIADVEALEAEEVLMYPNPADNEVTVTSAANVQTIRLFDATGRLVAETVPVAGQDTKFGLEALANGTYQLVVITDKRANSYRLVVQHVN